MKYAISDIHGHYRELMRLLEKSGFDESQDELYIVGDVIDRGPDGTGILAMAMERPWIHMSLGNHEDMMLKALCGTPSERDHYMQVWQPNGGGTTMDGLGRLPPGKRDELLAQVRGLPEYMDVDAGCNRYRLVHGSWADDRYNRLWESPSPIVPASNPEGRHLVVGHKPSFLFHLDRIRYLRRCGDSMQAFHGDGFTGIDCGAGLPDGYKKRALCLFRLDDRAEFYLPMP